MLMEDKYDTKRYIGLLDIGNWNGDMSEYPIHY